MKLSVSFVIASTICSQAPASIAWAASVGDAIKDSDTVIVGEILDGQAVSNGSMTDCWVSVSTDRVLKGVIGHGETIQIHWQYSSDQEPTQALPARIPKGNALWFLKQGSIESWAPMWVDLNSQPDGGYFMPLPSGTPGGIFSYSPEAPYESKLAGELGYALEALALQEGSRLDVTWAPPPRGGRPIQPRAQAGTVGLFQSLSFAFGALDAHASHAICEYFSASSNPELKAIGFLGRLKVHDVSALFEIESNMAILGRTWAAPEFDYHMAVLEISNDPAAVAAVGRMAIAENQWFGLDDMVVSSLSRANGLTAIPYLQVMLADKAEPYVRSRALQGLCQSFNRLGLASILNSTQFRQGCPVYRITPEGWQETLSSPSGTEEQRVEALQEWLIGEHDKLAKLTPMPQLSSPGWYANTGASDETPQNGWFQRR